jgi:hypothetical protein
VSSYGLSTPSTIASPTSPMPHLKTQKADLFSWPFAYLKHNLCKIVDVDFLEYTESENAWPFDTLKQRFIDFSKIVF